MPRKPNIPPCPNCKLQGGAYVPVAEFRACVGGRYFNGAPIYGTVAGAGFALACAICNARTEPRRSKAACLRQWKKASVVSPFERAREDRFFAEIDADIVAELARDRFLDQPSRPVPPPRLNNPDDDDIPF